MALLQEESSLQEIVRLVGRDSLSEQDQLKLEVAKSLREDYLQQNAFHDVDTFCSLEKQNKMMKVILSFYDQGLKGIEDGIYLSEIEKMNVRERITRMKYVSEEEISSLDEIIEEIEREMRELSPNSEDKGGTVNA